MWAGFPLLSTSSFPCSEFRELNNKLAGVFCRNAVFVYVRYSWKRGSSTAQAECPRASKASSCCNTMDILSGIALYLLYLGQPTWSLLRDYPAIHLIVSKSCKLISVNMSLSVFPNYRLGVPSTVVGLKSLGTIFRRVLLWHSTLAFDVSAGFIRLLRYVAWTTKITYTC